MARPIRIGIHPQSPAGPVLVHAPALAGVRAQLGTSVSWVEYGHGTQTPAQFAEDFIDAGLTGATPPLTIQAAGADIVYLAVGQPRPDSGAIVVPDDSPLQSVADLGGQRIGFAVGSWHSAFVALALDTAGLAYSDITPVSFVQTQGRVDTASVDAWVARPEEIGLPGFRTLIRSGEVWSNRSVVFARREVVASQPKEIAAFIAALDAAGRWLGNNPDQAGEILGKISPVNAEAIARGIRAQSGAEGLSQPDAQFFDEQQRAATLLSQAGVFSSITVTADAAVARIWEDVQNRQVALEAGIAGA